MGTLLLQILFVSVGAAIGGAAGWILRAANPQKPVEPHPTTAGDAEVCEDGSMEHINTLISRVHQLTAAVAADVGEHNTRVQAINDELVNGGDVVSIIGRLMTANAQMQSQLQDAEQRMQQQSREIESHCKEARTDSLTKLGNRRAFDDEIRRCIEARHTKNQPSCVMMVDVDFFKKFNDTYGHQAGDEVLRNVARVLRREATSEEIVCRYGGEEFAVIYPGMAVEAAIPRAEKARAAIAAEVIEFQGMDLRVTASGGVAELNSRETGEDFVKRADVALYVCKEKGRNCGYWHDGTTSRPMKGVMAPAAAAELPRVVSSPDRTTATVTAPAPTAIPPTSAATTAATSDVPVSTPNAAPATAGAPSAPKGIRRTPQAEPVEEVVVEPSEMTAKTPSQVPPSPLPSTAITVEPEAGIDVGPAEDQVFRFTEEPAAPKIQRRDRVSGLSDYGAFCRDVERRLAESRREGSSASLLLVSVDDCQTLQKEFGARAMDLALRHTAQIVKATRREMDHAAKCNDRVFALLLPGATAAEAKTIAERIRAEVENTPLALDGQSIPYSVSIGVTEFGTDDERELVIQRANRSLEAAQQAGGNRTMLLGADDTLPMLVASK